MTAIERVLDAITSTTGHLPRGSGRQWKALCPAHEDHNPSLSVTAGADRVLLRCHAGCSIGDITSAVGMSLADLYDEPLQRGSSDTWTPCGHGVTAEYRYLDEADVLLYTVVRCPKKCFAQWRPDPASKTGRRWSLGDVRRVLYRLPQLVAAVGAGRVIWVVEGEKDVHALEGAGVVATCNPGGAGKWRPEYNSVFTGADVVIAADNDRPGWAHAEQVANALLPVASSIEVVRAAVGKDAADHLAAGHRIGQFVHIAAPKPPSEVHCG